MQEKYEIGTFTCDLCCEEISIRYQQNIMGDGENFPLDEVVLTICPLCDRYPGWDSNLYLSPL